MTDLAQATAALVSATGQLVGTKAELLDWSVGTPNGGPSGDGLYPFTAADGTTILVPGMAKLKEIALGGANAETLAEVLGNATSKLALVDQATTDAVAARDQANAKAAYAGTQGDFAKAQGEAIGDVSAAVATATSAGTDAKAALQQLIAAEPMLLARANHTGTQPITANTETDDAKIMTAAERVSLGALNARTDTSSAYFEDTDRISIDPAGRLAQFVRASDGSRFGKLSLASGARIAPAYDPPSGQTILDIAPNSALVTAVIADYWEGASRVVMNMAGQILYATATVAAALTASGSLTAAISDYWEGTQRLSVNSAGTIVAFTPVPAQAASTGGTAALSSRVDSVVDAAGAPTSHLIGGRFLREFAYRRSQILDDAAAITLQVVIGPADSYTRLRTWARNMARKWRLELGNGGPGWTSAHEASSGTTPGTTTGNIDPAEMAVSFTGSGWSHQYLYGEGSPDNCTSTSSTAGDRITFTYNSTLYGAAAIAFASLFTTKTFLGPNGTGGGVLRYRWNGGAWTNIDVTANAYGASTPLAGIPAGNSWTLDVEIVSGTVAIAGLNALTGIQPGIVVHDLAVSGSDLYKWAGAGVASFRAHAATALTGLANGTPIAAFLCPISTNDQTYSRSYDDFQAAMETWIDGVARTVSPGCDILWIAPPENGRDVATVPQRIAGYTARAKIVQASRQIALLDMQPLFGAAYAEYGDAGTRRQLIGSDKLHPTDSGGALYRSTARNALTNRS